MFNTNLAKHIVCRISEDLRHSRRFFITMMKCEISGRRDVICFIFMNHEGLRISNGLSDEDWLVNKSVEVPESRVNQVTMFGISFALSLVCESAVYFYTNYLIFKIFYKFYKNISAVNVSFNVSQLCLRHFRLSFKNYYLPSHYNYRWRKTFELWNLYATQHTNIVIFSTALSRYFKSGHFNLRAILNRRRRASRVLSRESRRRVYLIASRFYSSHDVDIPRKSRM